MRYKKYKNSGISWIGEVPEHWTVTKLKFLGNAFGGLTYSPDDVVEDRESGTLVLRSSNIQNGKLSLNDNVFVIKRISEKLRLKKGDILICSRNGSQHLIGKNICIDERMEGSTFGAFMMIFRSENWRFLNYFFNSPIFTSQSSLFLTATINQLTSTTLNNFWISLPQSRGEQTQIAQFLDNKTSQIDKLITDKEKLIELLNEERTAIINQAVTKGLNPDVPMKDSGIEWLGKVPEHWTICKMKLACTMIKDGTHGSFSRVEEGFRLLSVRNIIEDKFVYREDDSRVSEKDYKAISSSFTINTNDIQLAIVGATLGKVAIVESISEAFVTQRSLATLRVKDSILLPYFLYYYLRSSTYQNFLWLSAGYSAQPGIYLGTLQNSFICLPSVEIQSQIVQYIGEQILAIKEVQFKIQQEIALLKEYKTALISEVVTGKIDVRDEIIAESTEPVT